MSTRTPSDRRRLLAAAALIAGGLTSEAWAQSPGDKVGRIVSGFPAGAGMDPLVRMLAERLRGKYQPAMIVENRTGAGGRIAAEAVRSAAPDGNTILFTPASPMVVFPHIYKSLSYDPVADFTPVTTVFVTKMGLVAGPACPAKTLAEYVAWVKQEPKNALYGSGGAGTMPHFLGTMFARAAGVPLTHVAYRGGAAVSHDLLGGQLPAAFSPIGAESVERHKSGKARVLAMAESVRTKQLPDVPTFAELGYTNLQLSEWFALFVPARTPPETVRTLATLVHAAMADPEIQAWLDRSQADMLLSSSAETAALMRVSTADWAKIVRETGYTAQD